MLKLKTPDDKTLYIHYDAVGTTPTARAVILVHGLTGHVDEHVHQVAYRYFNAQGYDVYRLSLYNWFENARRLVDCTLQTHADDLNLLVSYLRDTYQKLYVCGHSYGGLTTLLANPDVDATVFWDASFTPWEGFVRDEMRYNAEADCYLWGSGVVSVIGAAMYEEARDMDAQAPLLAAAFKPPALVALAEIGRINPQPTALYDALRGTKDMAVIEGSAHCFNEGETAHDLAVRSLAWLERF